MKKPLPFSVFKRANRPGYLVAFKNEKTGAYLPPISTRQTDESSAIKVAYEWYKHGVPKKDTVESLKDYTLRDFDKDWGINREKIRKTGKWRCLSARLQCRRILHDRIHR